jgi:putative SOS response-associated peptidase YedK
MEQLVERITKPGQGRWALVTRTFAIVTTGGSAEVAQLHDRMALSH